jgi:hypothetical protein
MSAENSPPNSNLPLKNFEGRKEGRKEIEFLCPPHTQKNISSWHAVPTGADSGQAEKSTVNRNDYYY